MRYYRKESWISHIKKKVQIIFISTKVRVMFKKKISIDKCKDEKEETAELSLPSLFRSFFITTTKSHIACFGLQSSCQPSASFQRLLTASFHVRIILLCSEWYKSHGSTFQESQSFPKPLLPSLVLPRDLISLPLHATTKMFCCTTRLCVSIDKIVIHIIIQYTL